MIALIFVVPIVVFLWWKIENKVHIKWHTFFQSHVQAQEDRNGTYCYCAKQGQGKTYSMVKFLQDHSNDMPIVSNIHLKGIKYTYINNFYDLMEAAKKGHHIIVYDEIFSKFNKNSKSDKATINFLSQVRKRGNIMLTTAQDWLELPMWLRRKVKVCIEVSRRNVLFWTFYRETYGDADHMRWSQEDNEYMCPLIQTSISMMTRKTAEAYDTFETIDEQ